MCLLIFCMKCCKAWTRSIYSWAYAHKHALCSSVTKSLRDAASVCIARPRKMKIMVMTW